MKGFYFYRADKIRVKHLEQQLNHHWLILFNQLVALRRTTRGSMLSGFLQMWWQNEGWRCESHLRLYRVRQEAADFPHSLLDLLFSGILLQDFIDVGDSRLAHLTVTSNLEAGLIQNSWKTSPKFTDQMFAPCLTQKLGSFIDGQSMTDLRAPSTGKHQYYYSLFDRRPTTIMTSSQSAPRCKLCYSQQQQQQNINSACIAFTCWLKTYG